MFPGQVYNDQYPHPQHPQQQPPQLQNGYPPVQYLQYPPQPQLQLQQQQQQFAPLYYVNTQIPQFNVSQQSGPIPFTYQMPQQGMLPQLAPNIIYAPTPQYQPNYVYQSVPQVQLQQQQAAPPPYYAVPAFQTTQQHPHPAGQPMPIYYPQNVPHSNPHTPPPPTTPHLALSPVLPPIASAPPESMISPVTSNASSSPSISGSPQQLQRPLPASPQPPVSPVRGTPVRASSPLPVVPPMSPLLSNRNVKGGATLSKPEIDTIISQLSSFSVSDATLTSLLPRLTQSQSTQITEAFSSATGKSIMSIFSDLDTDHFHLACRGILMTAAEWDAEMLYKSMAGIAMDVDGVVEILAGRQGVKEVGRAFAQSVKVEMKGEVLRRLKREFRDMMEVVLDTSRPSDPPEVNMTDFQEDLQMMIQACAKKNEMELLRLLITKSLVRTTRLIESFDMSSKKPLIETIEKQFSGDVKKLLLWTAHSVVNPAVAIARSLTKSLHGLTVDEFRLVRIIIRHRDPETMKNVARAFEEATGKSLTGRIERAVGAPLKKFLFDVVSANIL